MSTRGAGMTWVGRAIRRLEDPALVQGQGRFTADLPAAHYVRFVRSSVAAATISTIDAPAGATVITAADLKGVRPILPMLHKFAYRPVAQLILTDGTVRFVGEPVAAVVAASAGEAEDIADQVVIDIDAIAPVIDARAALETGAPLVHAARRRQCPPSKAGSRRKGFDEAWPGAHKIVKIDARSRRQNATPLEARGGHAAFDRRPAASR